MGNKHVLSQLKESAQMLSTAHRILDGDEKVIMTEKNGKRRRKRVWIIHDQRDEIFYAATHVNHPSSVWARTSVENYNWLVDHLFALSDEYTYRYGKTHATITRLGYQIQSPPNNLRKYNRTEIPCCMPDEYKISDDPVLNYQEYYRVAKKKLHKWKNREVPEWI